MGLITKTFGSGSADYTDIGAAIVACSGLGALSSNYLFKCIADHTQNTAIGPGVELQPNSFMISFDLQGHTITVAKTILMNISAYVDVSYSGTVEVKNGVLAHAGSLSGDFWRTALLHMKSGMALVNTQLMMVHDILAVDAGLTGDALICLEADPPTTVYHAWNIRGYNYGMTAGLWMVNGGALGAGCNQTVVENCAFYHDKDKTGIATPSYGNYTTFENVALVHSGSGSSFDWADDTVTTHYPTIVNCAVSDSSCPSYATGTVSGTGISDFVSVDPASPNYLKITGSSRLYGVGSKSISLSTKDFVGQPRPNANTKLVSIGAYEPVQYPVVNIGISPSTGKAPLRVGFSTDVTYAYR